MKYLLILACLLAFYTGFAQTDTTTPPYKRFPTLPPINLLLGDSTTKYTKEDVPSKKPVLLMLFSPECSHCQHTAEEMVKYKDELKNIHIVMATLHPLYQMNEFVEKYNLKQMENVVVGKDAHYFMPPFYNIKSLPYLAFYNKKKALIQGFEGSMSVPNILKVFEKKD